MKFRNFTIAVLSLLIISAVASAHPFDQTYDSAVEALDTYRALIKDYPDDLELYYLLGDMLIMANELEEAEEKFMYVLDKDEHYDMAWYKLSEIYYREKDYKKALEPLQNMTEKSLQDEKVIAEATIYLRLEDFEKVIELSEEAIEIDELNPGGWLHKGLAKNEMGEHTEAIDLIFKSLSMDPGQPLVYEWFRDIIREHLEPEKQHTVLKKLYDLIPYDTPVAQQIIRDIYHIKRRMKEENTEDK
ncbi:MAG TPA: tetratricopeptide repeat protein [bacterium]|nr:tetratricopeptide repeat protein [bacterium]